MNNSENLIQAIIIIVDCGSVIVFLSSAVARAWLPPCGFQPRPLHDRTSVRGSAVWGQDWRTERRKSPAAAIARSGWMQLVNIFGFTHTPLHDGTRTYRLPPCRPAALPPRLCNVEPALIWQEQICNDAKCVYFELSTNLKYLYHISPRHNIQYTPMLAKRKYEQCK